MERQDLQLHSKINLAHVHSHRHRQRDRREIEDACDSRGDKAVAHCLRSCRRRADDTYRHLVALDKDLHLVKRADHDATDGFADPAGVDIEQGDHTESPGLETAVSRERVAEVADPDQQNRTVLGQPELGGYTAEQEVHVVADATRPVRAEVGQILADLRRGHARRLRQCLGRHRTDCPICQRGEDPQVQREAGNCRLRHGRAFTDSGGCPPKLGHVRLPHHSRRPTADGAGRAAPQCCTVERHQ